MIYLLFGPDTYSSRKKFGEIITAFREKAGAASGIGLTRVDAAEEPNAIFSVGRTASLFSKKELVVIEQASTVDASGKAHIEGQLPRWVADPTLAVIFWEGDVVIKKHPLLVKIQEAALKSQEFSPLSPALLGRWLDREAAERGLKIHAEEKRILMQTFGPDLWALSGELEKIRHGWSPREASRTATPIWDFTDAFLWNRRSAFLPLARLLDAGFDAVYIAAALGGAFRTMAIIWKGMESGRLKTLAGRLHPFVVRKHLESVRRLDAAALRRRFADLLRADTELKTGQLPSPLSIVKLVLRQ